MAAILLLDSLLTLLLSKRVIYNVFEYRARHDDPQVLSISQWSQ